MAEKKKKEPKEIPSRVGRAGKSRKQQKDARQTKPIKMADGEKIPKGVDKAILSTDAAGESHVIMTVSYTGLDSKKSVKEKAPSKASEAKRTTKKIKFKKAMADKRGKIEMVEAEGVPYTSKNGLNVALHKEHDGWYATEISTGKLCTTEGKTTMSAAKAEVEQNSSIVKKLLQHPKDKVKPIQLKKTAEKLAQKAAPLSAKKDAKNTAGKRSEPKTAAPKNEPTVAKKPAGAKKNTVDKLLQHSDRDEMNVAGEKPIVINGVNAKPKQVPKVLRRVAKTGGYTAWDDIKRNGKTFATEKEAKDYAADLLKKTGKIVPISPTDRQVTHTFKPEEEKKKK